MNVLRKGCDPMQQAVIAPTANGASPAVQSLPSGKWYREPLVIAQIESLLCCGRSEFLRRMRIGEYTQEGFVCEEALVYFVRERSRAGANVEAGDLIELLEKRCMKRISKKLRGWSNLTETQRDDCYQDILDRMITAILSREVGDEFWEVRFWHCLDCRISNAAQRYYILAQNEFIPDSGENEDGRKLDYIGSIPATGGLTSDQRALVAEALRMLSEDLRRVFMLFHYEQWTQEEIAKQLKITDRTVRNRLDKAEKQLAIWRADEPN